MPRLLSINPREFHGVWVYIEHQAGKAAGVCWELLSPGRELADLLGVELGVIIIGDTGSHLATEAFAYGADVAYLIDGPVFTRYRSETHLRALTHLLKSYKPELVLFGATVTGKELAAATAVEMQTGLVAECINFTADVGRRIVQMTQSAMGGQLLATVLCENNRPQLATVRPGIMPLPPRKPGRAGRIVRLGYTLKEAEVATKILSFTPAKVKTDDLTEADIVVGVGRGIGHANQMYLIDQLAAALGGVVAVSRAVVDRGWAPATRQVGKTGKTVRPRLYVAVGISGATQHLAGMRNAETIIAINHDPHAPIFNIATQGIVGDLFKVLPELTRQLQRENNLAGKI